MNTQPTMPKPIRLAHEILGRRRKMKALASTLALAFRLRKAPPLQSNKADRLPSLTCPSK